MALVSDIAETYRAPRQVMRRQLAESSSEERALGLVMGASLLTFLSRLPVLIREVTLQGPDGPPLAGLAAAMFVATMIFAPLFLYGIAALSHLVARGFGGQGTWLRARIALFWSLLALSPLVLLRGAVAGYLGEGYVSLGVSLFTGTCFVVIWVQSLREAEQSSGSDLP